MEALLFFLLFLNIAGLYAQTPKVCIKSIELAGNKKTKPSTILGQLDFAQGDSILLENLQPTLDLNKRYILNLLLFDKAEVKIAKWDGVDVTIKIQVSEFWYIYLLPGIELGDRNFNVWWRDFHHDIRRVNFAGEFLWRNMLGYNDLLKVIGQVGFTQKLELDYALPPANKHRPWGFGANLLFSNNRVWVNNTVGNRLIFYGDFGGHERQFRRWRVTGELHYRPSLFDWFWLEANYLNLHISDSMALRNRDFFLHYRTQQQTYNFIFNYKRDRRDIAVYPLKGYYIKAAWETNLGDITQTALEATFALYHRWHKRWSMGFYTKGRYAFFQNQQPYYNQKALGYLLDYVRGYQYYAINGQTFWLWQSDLNYKLFDFEIPLARRSKQPYFQKLPMKIHLRYHYDMGYVLDKYYYKENPLNNTLLIGTGVGLDFVFYYYKLVVQLEYSVNRSREKGVFLRLKFNL